MEFTIGINGYSLDIAILRHRLSIRDIFAIRVHTPKTFYSILTFCIISKKYYSSKLFNKFLIKPKL